jgi:hypothetical protein
MKGDTMEAKIKLTKTMLDKSIIDANKSVREFLDHDFGMNYDDEFFTIEWYDTEKERTMRNAFSVIGIYADGAEGDVKFYRSAKRGDKRISIQKLKQYAEAGDEVILTSNVKDAEGEYLIYINIVRQTDAA